MTGRVRDDGQLEIYKSELNDFLAKHKGEKVVLTLQPLPKEKTKGMLSYYFAYVVPKFKQAMWENGERLTDKQVEKRLRELSPVMQEQEADEQGRYRTRLRLIAELNNAELYEHIEALKQIGAEEYSIYIEDPNE